MSFPLTPCSLDDMKTKLIRLKRDGNDEEALKEAGDIIKAGGLVAFPTETVYGLGGDALNPASSEKIYAAKGRPSDNPLIVHICDIKAIEKIASDIPDYARKLADRYWPGPMTLIFNKTDAVPHKTTGGLDTVAVRFPSDKEAASFIGHAGGYVAAPSANISGKPSPTSADRVFEDLNGRIEMILDGGRCDIGLESTIIDATGDHPVILRPGYITEEDIKEITGSSSVDPALEDPNARPKAPGMKYRHYAPKGEMTIVRGDTDRIVSYINNELEKAAIAGEKSAVITVNEHEHLYKDTIVKSIGSSGDPADAAHNLYSLLRELDDEEVKIIYAEGFPETGFYKALMNRMKKAAGGRLIDL